MQPMNKHGMTPLHGFASWQLITRWIFLVSTTMSPHLVSGQTVRIYSKNKQVRLFGRIALTHGYGPPGWGEDPKHDAHVHYWTVTLSKEINVSCTPERPEYEATDCRPTKVMRLLIDEDVLLVGKAGSLSGQRALVTGSLHRADVAGEMTPIYMTVTDIINAHR